MAGVKDVVHVKCLSLITIYLFLEVEVYSR